MSRDLMIADGTPVDDYTAAFGLYVKREDLSCLPPGPPFSKARGVYAHIKGRPEEIIGVLDTRHSQGGWAVAQACRLLGRRCVVFYPGFKDDDMQPKTPQLEAERLGADLGMLPAGRSAILYHAARRHLGKIGGEAGRAVYMMPNALKLPESVEETAREVGRTPAVFDVKTVLVPASSATIASGVLVGLLQRGWMGTLIVHLGYSRSQKQVLSYMRSQTPEGLPKHGITIEVVDEGYAYKDVARLGGDVPPWRCNEFYDLKTFRWWTRYGRSRYGKAMMWNIG